MSALLGAARGVLDHALRVYAQPGPPRGVLLDARSRLDEPLRVALAGTLKSGKSTLLNALVGERVAPTDAGECTRVVTWYRNGATAAITREGRDGQRSSLPVVRGADGLEIDAGSPQHVRRLLVDWPSRGLADTTLIDTPGLDSLREANSARTLQFVTPDDRPSGADSVSPVVRRGHR